MIPLHRFRPRLQDTLAGYTRATFAQDLGAGLTVGIVALPLAMAFAIASGVKPEQGLFTAVIAGFLIAALGGSNVQIGGPAGAFIVIVYGIVERYGLANLLIATSLAGVLLFGMGLLRLGALVRYLPVTIVIGFTNGIAVLIGLSQMKDLLGLKIDKLPADFFSQIAVLARHASELNPAALAVGLASLALVVVWPKSYTMPVNPQGWLPHLRRWAARVPGTVIVLVGATLVTAVLHLPVETIGSRFGGIPSALPDFALPEFSWVTVKQLIFPTITIAMLGAIESLLCARVADQASDLPRHDPNQELMAQGIANFLVPFFGGIPATGTIARTITNVRAGGRTPVAGMVHALALLAILLALGPLAAQVPLAALAGILLFVAWNMGEWREFGRLGAFTLPYRTILVGTFLATVIFDLTVAVEGGLVLSCLFFIYRMSVIFRIEPVPAGEVAALAPAAPADVQVFRMFGSLFFGAVGKLEALRGQVAPGARLVVLELHQLISLDTSGLDTLEQFHKELLRDGIGLRLVALNTQPASLLRRSGFAETLGNDRIHADLAQAIAAG